MMLVSLSLLLLWLGILSDSPIAAPDERYDELFAAGVIEPSETALEVINLFSLGKKAAAPVSLVHQETLDRALVDRDWENLDQAIVALHEEVGPATVLDWLSTRHAAGYIAASTRYARYSMALGVTEDDEDLKGIGVMLWHYIIATIHVDGTKCVDGTAPDMFWKKIEGELGLTQRHARDLPWDELHDIQSFAKIMEEKIASERHADPTICMATSLSIEDFLNNHIEHMMSSDWSKADVEVEETPEGKVALELRFPMEKGYHTAIKPTDAWRDEAAKRRMTLPKVMEQLAAALKG